MRILTAIAFALAAAQASAQEAADYVGLWSASQGGQTIAYELNADGSAAFVKDGEKQGGLTWGVRDGAGYIASPYGDFALELQGDAQLMITPPAAIGAPGAVFARDGG